MVYWYETPSVAPVKVNWVFNELLTGSYTVAGLIPTLFQIDVIGSVSVSTNFLYLHHIEPIFNNKETGTLCRAGI